MQNRASFRRRLAASIYDIFLAAAVFLLCGFVSTAVFVLSVEQGLMPEIESFAALQQRPDLYYYYIVWVRCLAFGAVAWFYIWFWCRGQTLGMRAWWLSIQSQDGSALPWHRMCIRFFWSLFGLGNFLIPFQKERLALQDSMTNTEVVYTPLA